MNSPAFENPGNSQKLLDGMCWIMRKFTNAWKFFSCMLGQDNRQIAKLYQYDLKRSIIIFPVLATNRIINNVAITNLIISVRLINIFSVLAKLYFLCQWNNK